MLALHIEAFSKLTPEERALLEEYSRRNVREIPARHDIIREGEKPRAVHLVLEGWACRYKQLPNGRRQILHFLIAGDLCDSNVFLLKEMDHSLGAVTPLRYAEISQADFEALAQSSARIGKALWWNELVNAAIAREWIANVGQRTALERIAHLLCEMYLRLSWVGLADGGGCDWPPTQTDLADATGLTAVHVNRTLQELRRRRLIELDNRRLRILDLEALKQEAMFNPNYLHLDRAAAAAA